MSKKYFLSFTSLTLVSTFFLSSISPITSVYHSDIFHDDYNSPNSKRIILNVQKIEQETHYYCFPAVLQETFRFFGFNYPQNYIYQHLGGVAPNGVDLSSSNNINWINNQLRIHNIVHQYYHVNIPMNFGSTNEQRLLFQNFVTSSLSQGVPILLSTWHNLRRSYHVTLIYGIEINEQSPLETIYYYHDPMTQSNQSFFVAAQIPTVVFGHGPGRALGANANFDFINQQIKIKVPDQRFSGDLQDKTIEQNQATDLTKEAGIINLTQLKNFKSVNLIGLNIKTKWFDQSYEYKSDYWKTKWFTTGQNEFKKYDQFSWINKYRNISQGQFITYYSSSTWKEDDGNFYLNLTYQFFAQSLLTTTLIYVQIFLGTKWVLSF